MKSKILIEKRKMITEKVKELSEKFTIAEIADKLGVSTGTVCTIQNNPENGIINPRRKCPGYNKAPRMQPAEGCLDYNKMG